MMDRAALTHHQEMVLQGGIPARDRGRFAAFLESYRGGVPRRTWPNANRILQLVGQRGEARLDALGIPADQRQGAAIEIVAGGPQWSGATWSSIGVIVHWEREADDWILKSIERRHLGGGPDTARLATTPEQDRISYEFFAREAADAHARRTGERD